MKEFLKNALATAIAVAILAIVWEIPQYLHKCECNGHDCNWFWCDHYNGKGSI